MELFKGARAVRLRSHHNKYLVAEDDRVHVSQDRSRDAPGALWTVDLAVAAPFLRLKSLYDSYLTASNEPFLLGMNGYKVIQTKPARLDSSVEWEPIREGNQVKLKNRNSGFLRANSGVRPWRNSVTNDIPRCNPIKKWVLWDVEIAVHQSTTDDASFSTPGSSTSAAHENPSSSPPSMSPRLESTLSFSEWLPDTSSRTIDNSVEDDDGDVKGIVEEPSFSFSKLAEELDETQHTGINRVLLESGERKAPSS